MKKEDKYEKVYEMLDRFASTKSHKKLLNYLEESLRAEGIENIRKKYGIPINGFKDGNSYDKWNNALESKKRLKIFKLLGNDIQKLSKKVNIFNFEGIEMVESYLYFNSFDFIPNPCFVNLCIISDIILEREEPLTKEIAEGDDKMFPIAIRVSPYASRRDIVDFVEGTYKLSIRPLQEKYAKKNVLIGKIKSKNPFIKERNEFIYKNKVLPRRKIKELVEEKFNVSLDYEYIGKIISDENKKRKKV